VSEVQVEVNWQK